MFEQIRIIWQHEIEQISTIREQMIADEWYEPDFRTCTLDDAHDQISNFLLPVGTCFVIEGETLLAHCGYQVYAVYVGDEFKGGLVIDEKTTFDTFITCLNILQEQEGKGNMESFEAYLRRVVTDTINEIKKSPLGIIILANAQDEE